MRWDWIPCVMVGEFKFGERFDPGAYSEEIVLLPPACKGADWQTYRVGDEAARVAVEDGVITRVECVESICFKGTEMIGLSEEELPAVLGALPQEVDRWPPGNAQLDVEQLGITLWMEDGYVESATVWNPAQFEEEPA
jgi:hypothetical protein